METTNTTLVNFYMVAKFVETKAMEGFVAQMKLFKSSGELVGTGWHTVKLYNSLTKNESCISSFAAFINPDETYYMELSVVCKFMSRITGTIRLGNTETLSIDSEVNVMTYTTGNYSNHMTGSDIIYYQNLPTITTYNMPLPNYVEITFN